MGVRPVRYAGGAGHPADCTDTDNYSPGVPESLGPVPAVPAATPAVRPARRAVRSGVQPLPHGPYPTGGPYQPGVVATTNGKATASLICAIASFFCFGPFLSVPAIILGVLARREIARTGGQQGGSGQALAGIIIGIVVTVISVLAIIGLIALISTGNLDNSYNDTGTF